MPKKKPSTPGANEKGSSKSRGSASPEKSEVSNRKSASIRGKHRAGRRHKSSEDWRQLDELGLKIYEVVSDGNCCFRAIAHQLEGRQDGHSKLRSLTVDYVEDHEDDFKYFIEDDVPFAEYCSNMRADGTWAGNLELQAMSLLTKTNICIHQLNEPRWHLNNFPDPSTPMIHVSYHDGQHYNSVVKKENEFEIESHPINIDDIVEDYNKSKSTTKLQSKSKKEKSNSIVETKSVMSNQTITTQNDSKVPIIADDDDNYSDGDKFKDEVEEGGSCITVGYDIDHVKAFEDESDDNVSLNSKKRDQIVDGSNDGLKIKKERDPRNKPCSCGSKKKFKNCCGTTSNRKVVQISRFSNGASLLSSRERKTRIKSSKAYDLENENVVRDLGSLCI